MQLNFDANNRIGAVQMLRQLQHLGGGRFARPALEMLAVTDLLVSDPIRAGREFLRAAPQQFGKAASYFFAALSTGFVLTQVAVSTLGIERIEQLAFWVLSVGLIACVARREWHGSGTRLSKLSGSCGKLRSGSDKGRRLAIERDQRAPAHGAVSAPCGLLIQLAVPDISREPG
jgi:hypothetical protein